MSNFKQQQQQQPKKTYGVYIKSMLTMKVQLSITEIGKNIKQNLEKMVSHKTEGRCIVEGFIKPNSVKVLSYSSGVVNSDIIEFQTTFECMVCHPVEGMNIECEAKTLTKAGIHAEVKDDNDITPVTVFIARDHHHMDRLFASIKEGQKITVRVIGVRYELNDPYICVIGKLIEPETRVFHDRQPNKPPINILED